MTRVWDIEVDDSVMNIEGGGVRRVVPGDYLLVVQKVAPCSLQWAEDPKNADKKPWMRVSTTIKAGPDAIGRSYSELVSFAPNAYFRLGQLVAATGGNPEKLKAIRIQGSGREAWEQFAAVAVNLTKFLAEKEVGALIGDNVNSGQPSSQVQEFYSADRYQERSQFQAARPAASNGAPDADTSKAQSELQEILAGGGLEL